MTETCRIGIVGCAGRMGRMLLAETLAAPAATLAGGSGRLPGGAAAQDLGLLAGGAPLGLTVTNDVEALFRASDVVIDFTVPGASVAHADLAAKLGKGLVIGTTGLSGQEMAAVEKAAAHSPVVWAPNMSLGVNLLLGLVEQVAGMLKDDWDIEIVEMHHRNKVDAPSGTALGLGRAAAKGRGVELDEVWVKSRDGLTGARQAGSIGFATLRGGDVIGDHTVVFAGNAERVELTHKATDRRVFARGAVRAALWLKGKPAGLYGMKDVLGL
ncbi:MAG TPA: 4-hydroxy-tetrahydrodipicolinate reductase [Stellaceae bacterium]|nr:4-hydroxy-tetrahydrodipicolinate reductase [Stellaceae bacterium]